MSEEKKSLVTQAEERDRTIGYLLGIQDANKILMDLVENNPNDKQLGKEVRRIMLNKKNKKDGK
jgi:phage terminase large subunit-like protein